MTQPPLIMFPGIGGDARLFANQRTDFPELVVPPWIEPEPYEPLAAYAARFAKVVDPGCRCFVGGVSFGGVVALEVATHLAAQECFLLGTIRDPKEMPRRLKVFRQISNLIMIPKWLAPFGVRYGGRWMRPHVHGVVKQLNEADPRFLRWAAWAILNWTPSAAVAQVKVTRIHGGRDQVFPSRYVSADLFIPEATHLVSVSYAKEVNSLIRARMSAASSETPSDN